MTSTESGPTYVPFRRALVHVAGDLLVREPGERIPPGEEYQRALGVGSGTILKALRTLSDSGAVALEPRGYRGTVILSRDVGALWRAAERDPIRVALTLPGAPDHYGLTIGFVEELRRLGVPFEPMFASSGAVRAAWVDDGQADVAVMSLIAARSVEATTPRLEVRDVAPVLYYGRDQIVVVARAEGAPVEGSSAERAPGARRRVGVDESSPDHVALTHEEFGDDPTVEWVPCAFRDIPAEILRGGIDTGVWHRVEAPIPPELAGLAVRPWRPHAEAAPETQTAAWCLRREDPAIAAVLDALDVRRIRAAQEEVMRTETMEAIQTRLWTR